MKNDKYMHTSTSHKILEDWLIKKCVIHTPWMNIMASVCYFLNLRRIYKTGFDIIFHACYVAQAGTHYVTQAGLNLKQSSWFSLPLAGITDISPHAWLNSIIFKMKGSIINQISWGKR